MNPGHLWEGGAERRRMERCSPQHPTEGSLYNANHCSSTVHSALPLIHAPAIVKNFWFTFKDGEVVDYGVEEAAHEKRN